MRTVVMPLEPITRGKDPGTGRNCTHEADQSRQLYFVEVDATAAVLTTVQQYNIIVIKVSKHASASHHFKG